MTTTLKVLERGLRQGLSRWKRAKSPQGKAVASALIEDALLNMDVMLGRTQHFRAMLHRGEVDINLVEQWLKERGKS